jgi:hypothetical protein
MADRERERDADQHDLRDEKDRGPGSRHDIDVGHDGHDLGQCRGGIIRAARRRPGHAVRARDGQAREPQREHQPDRSEAQEPPSRRDALAREESGDQRGRPCRLLIGEKAGEQGEGGEE